MARTRSGKQHDVASREHLEEEEEEEESPDDVPALPHLPLKDFLKCSQLGWYCVQHKSSFQTIETTKNHLTRAHGYIYKQTRKERSVILKEIREYVVQVKKEAHAVELIRDNPPQLGIECSKCLSIFPKDSQGARSQHENKVKCWTEIERGELQPTWRDCYYLPTTCFRNSRVSLAETRRQQHNAMSDNTNRNTPTIRLAPSPVDTSSPNDNAQSRVNESDEASRELNPFADDLAPFDGNMFFPCERSPHPPHSVQHTLQQVFDLHQRDAMEVNERHCDVVEVLKKYTHSTAASERLAGQFFPLANIGNTDECHAFIEKVVKWRCNPIQDSETDSLYIKALQRLGKVWIDEFSSKAVRVLATTTQYQLGLRENHPLSTSLDSTSCAKLPPTRMDTIDSYDEELSGLVSFGWRFDSRYLDSFKKLYKDLVDNETTDAQMIIKTIFPHFLCRVFFEDHDNPMNSRTLGCIFSLSLCFIEDGSSSNPPHIRLNDYGEICSSNTRYIRLLRLGAAALIHASSNATNFNVINRHLVDLCRNNGVSCFVMVLISDLSIWKEEEDYNRESGTTPPGRDIYNELTVAEDDLRRMTTTAEQRSEELSRETQRREEAEQQCAASHLLLGAAQQKLQTLLEENESLKEEVRATKETERKKAAETNDNSTTIMQRQVELLKQKIRTCEETNTKQSEALLKEIKHGKELEEKLKSSEMVLDNAKERVKSSNEKLKRLQVELTSTQERLGTLEMERREQEEDQRLSEQREKEQVSLPAKRKADFL